MAIDQSVFVSLYDFPLEINGRKLLTLVFVFHITWYCDFNFFGKPNLKCQVSRIKMNLV